MREDEPCCFVLEDLPLLCIDLVGEALVREFKRDSDDKKRPSVTDRQAAQTAAALAIAGGPILTKYSEALFDNIVDPGCAEAKRAALRTNLVKTKAWETELATKRKEEEEDEIDSYEYQGVCGEWSSLSRSSCSRAQLIDACRQLKLGVSGPKARLWANLDEFRSDGIARLHILDKLLDGSRRSNHLFRLRCPVRPTARLLLDARMRSSERDDYLLPEECLAQYGVKRADLLLFNVDFRLERTPRTAFRLTATYNALKVAELGAMLHGPANDTAYWEDADGEAAALVAYHAAKAEEKRRRSKEKRLNERRAALLAIQAVWGVDDRDVRFVPGAGQCMDLFVNYPRKCTEQDVTVCFTRAREMVDRREALRTELVAAGVFEPSDFEGERMYTIMHGVIAPCRRYVTRNVGKIDHIVSACLEARFISLYVLRYDEHSTDDRGEIRNKQDNLEHVDWKWTEVGAIRKGRHFCKWVSRVTTAVAAVSNNEKEEPDFVTTYPAVPGEMLRKYLPGATLAFACARLGFAFREVNQRHDCAEEIMSRIIVNGFLQEYVCNVYNGDAVLGPRSLSALYAERQVDQRVKYSVKLVSKIRKRVSEYRQTDLPMIITLLADARISDCGGNESVFIRSDREHAEAVNAILRSPRRLLRARAELDKRRFRLHCCMCPDIMPRFASKTALEEHVMEEHGHRRHHRRC
jgi:hypothetical protein